MTALAALLRPQANYAVGKPARAALTWCGFWAATTAALAVLSSPWWLAVGAALCATLGCVHRAGQRWAGQLEEGGEDGGEWIDPGLPARYDTGRAFLADFRWDQFIADGGVGFAPDWAAWSACLADALGDLLDGIDVAGCVRLPAAQHGRPAGSASRMPRRARFTACHLPRIWRTK